MLPLGSRLLAVGYCVHLRPLLYARRIVELREHAWFSQVDWSNVAAVDESGELVSTAPYKPRKMRMTSAKVLPDAAPEDGIESLAAAEAEYFEHF